MTPKGFGEMTKLTWRNPGTGRYHKRRLSKARRQVAKQEIAVAIGRQTRIHDQGYQYWSRMCNWKGT